MPKEVKLRPANSAAGRPFLPHPCSSFLVTESQGTQGGVDGNIPLTLDKGHKERDQDRKVLNTGSQGRLRGSAAEKQAVQTAGCGPPAGKVSLQSPGGGHSSWTDDFQWQVLSICSFLATQTCSCELLDSCRLSGALVCNLYLRGCAGMEYFYIGHDSKLAGHYRII